MKDFNSIIDELKYRGLLAQSTDITELQNLLDTSKIKLYIGFDPTAPSLHHGNLVQLILLKHFQNYGHTPICLVGGATGLIGDPRQSGERKLNDSETVTKWVEKLKANFKRFLDFEENIDNNAEIVNNFDWTKDYSCIEFLREIGKHFRVSNMLAKETVAARLNSSEGISFTEFSYQILQAFDYYTLSQKYDVVLQCGGNDQWGNLTAGTDLIRKMTGKTVHALTTPIITKSDGTKFGKSEGGAIWIDPSMMSPYAFYQFWLNVADNDVVKLLKAFTFLPKSNIEDLEKEVENNPGSRQAQKTLASEVTKYVHGQESLDQAIEATNVLFGKGSIESLDSETLESLGKEIGFIEAKIDQNIGELSGAAGFTKSNNEYRTAVKQNAISINNVKVTDFESNFKEENLLHNKYALLKKGKKQFTIIKLGEK